MNIQVKNNLLKKLCLIICMTLVCSVCAGMITSFITFKNMSSAIVMTLKDLLVYSFKNDYITESSDYINTLRSYMYKDKFYFEDPSYPGEVIISAYSPENPIYIYSSRQNYTQPETSIYLDKSAVDNFNFIKYNTDYAITIQYSPESGICIYGYSLIEQFGTKLIIMSKITIPELFRAIFVRQFFVSVIFIFITLTVFYLFLSRDEKLLSKKYSKLLGALDTSQMPICVVDFLNHNVLYSNKEMELLCANRENRKKTKSFFSRQSYNKIPRNAGERKLPCFDCSINRFSSHNGEIYESQISYEWKSKETGKIYNILESISDQGNTKYKTTIIGDITDFTISSTKIKRQTSILNSLVDVLISFDLNKKIQYINDSGRKIIGCKEDEFETLDQLISEGIIKPKTNYGRVNDYAELVLNQKEPQAVKGLLKNYDSAIIPVDITIFPTYDNEGILLGFAMLIHDISDVEEGNEKIKRYAKQQQFIAYLSVLMMSMEDFESRIKNLIIRIATYFDSKNIDFIVKVDGDFDSYEASYHLSGNRNKYEFNENHPDIDIDFIKKKFYANDYIIYDGHENSDEKMPFIRYNDTDVEYIHIGLKISYDGKICGCIYFDVPKNNNVLGYKEDYDTKFILTLQNIIVMAVEGYISNRNSELYSIYMHSIFNANKDLILFLDPNGTIVNTNGVAYYGKEDIGLNIYEAIDNIPEDEKGTVTSGMIKEQIEIVKSTLQASSYDNNTRKGIILHTEYYPILDKGNNLLGIICLFKNITERIRMQNELSIERQRINNMLDSLPISFYICDKELNLVSISSDLLTDEYWETIKEQSPNRIEKIKNVFNGESTNFLIYYQNHYLTNYVYPFYEGDSVEFVLGIAFDITKRHIAELNAKKAEIRLDMAVNAINAGFIEYNLSTNEFIYDDAIKLLCDIQNKKNSEDTENLDNIILHKLIGNKDILEIKNNCVIAENNRYFLNNGIILKNGSKRQLLTCFYYLKEETIIGEYESKLVGVTIDYTNQYKQDKKIIDEKERAESELAVKSQFLSRIGYEIRTPMNAIIGMIKIAKRSKDIEKIQNCFEKIEISSMHLLSIINDVLDISTMKTGKLTVVNEEFDFENFIMETVSIASMQTEEKRQDITVRISPNIPKELYGDKMRLNQVILNLMSNAIKFTPDEGKVGLTIDVKELSTDEVKLKFSVYDTGIGMSAEQIDKLFFGDSDITNYENTGLGLMITKNIIDALNGTIWAESKLDQGSRVSFTVPLKIVAEKDSPQLPENVKEEDVRILILDSDDDVREEMRLILDSCRFNHDVTGDSTQAINMAKSAAEQNNPYNVIFIDWEMPDIDGIEIITKILKVSVDSKIVIMTSMYDHEEVKRQALRLGIDKVLSKPLYPSLIVNAIVYSVKKSILYVDNYDFSDITILVVDDIDINVEIIKELMAPTNINIDVAYSGIEAVNLYKKNPLLYSLILMDIQMFDIDGYMATREIRESNLPRCDEIPIIALTVNFTPEDIAEEEAYGINAHLNKPINETELLDTIKKYAKNDIIKKHDDYAAGELLTSLTKLSLPGIDIQTGLGRLDNKTNLYLRLLKNFRGSNHLIDIKAYVSEGNKKEALSEAHSIKGIAGNLGLYNLMSAASSIYDVLKSDVMEIHGPEFLYFETIYNETLKNIDVILKKEKI